MCLTIFGYSPVYSSSSSPQQAGGSNRLAVFKKLLLGVFLNLKDMWVPQVLANIAERYKCSIPHLSVSQMKIVSHFWNWRCIFIASASFINQVLYLYINNILCVQLSHFPQSSYLFFNKISMFVSLQFLAQIMWSRKTTVKLTWSNVC